MDDDALRSDDELTAELAAIDASLHHDGPAALRGFAARPGLLALAQAHQATVRTRRTVVVALLDDAALPRRLAALDDWFYYRSDAPPGREFLTHPSSRLVHWAQRRSALMSRLEAAIARRGKASGGLYFGPWKGFSPLP